MSARRKPQHRRPGSTVRRSAPAGVAARLTDPRVQAHALDLAQDMVAAAIDDDAVRLGELAAESCRDLALAATVMHGLARAVAELTRPPDD